MIAVDKYHGLGNDFLVALDPAEEPDAATARALCDRRRGAGADGLLVGRSATTVPGLPTDLTFRLFNADGSEAEMSGNGIRCLVHAAIDAGVVDGRTPVSVATPAGVRHVAVGPSPDGRGIWATVAMGVARVTGEEGRCNVGHGQLLVDVGNPHLVVAGPDPAGVDVAHLGPVLEATDPAGRNVEFATLGPGPDEITMRVWERGVGETEACGTGSCAAAAAFAHWGRVGRSVTVHQPGGSVAVVIADDGEVTLSGPSVRVGRFEGAPEPAAAR